LGTKSNNETIDVHLNE